MRIKHFKLRPKDHPFPIIAWFIMIFQGFNPFKKEATSHMAMSYISETGAEKIIDMAFGGFREMKYADFFKKYKIIDVKTKEYEISRKEFLSWKENHEPKGYDFLQLFGLVLKLLKLKKVNYIGNDFKNLICSELIISFLVRFDKLKVKDSDNWDLNMTWDAI